MNHLCVLHLSSTWSPNHLSTQQSPICVHCLLISMSLLLWHRLRFPCQFAKSISKPPSLCCRWRSLLTVHIGSSHPWASPNRVIPASNTYSNVLCCLATFSTLLQSIASLLFPALILIRASYDDFCPPAHLPILYSSVFWSGFVFLLDPLVYACFQTDHTLKVCIFSSFSIFPKFALAAFFKSRAQSRPTPLLRRTQQKPDLLTHKPNQHSTKPLSDSFL